MYYSGLYFGEVFPIYTARVTIFGTSVDVCVLLATFYFLLIDVALRCVTLRYVALRCVRSKNEGKFFGQSKANPCFQRNRLKFQQKEWFLSAGVGSETSKLDTTRSCGISAVSAGLGLGVGMKIFGGPGECSRSLAVAGISCDQKSIRLDQWCAFIFNQRMDAHMGPLLEIPCNKEWINGDVILILSHSNTWSNTCLFSEATFSIFLFVLVGIIAWRSFGELLCRDLDLKLGHHRSPLRTVRIQLWKFEFFL